MPDAPRLTVPRLKELVSDASELAKGAQIADAKGLAHLSRFETRLYADAAGSGASPYKVSISFDETGGVKSRCSCMAARSRPVCKHAAALLVSWQRSPEAFVVSEQAPPEAEGSGKKKAVKTGKAETQELMKAGVEQAATLVRELALSGAASLGADRAAQVRGLAETLRANRLRRLSAKTLELADLLDAAARRRGELSAGAYTGLLADMLLTVRKLEKHLAGEAIEDRHVEELVGKTWRKEDRKPVAGLDLVEYAFSERLTADSFLVRESRFLDARTGTHYSEKQILPSFLVKRTEPKKSWSGSLLPAMTGGAYPGFAPVRLDLETPQGVPLVASVIQALLEQCLPDVGAAVAAFQEHRRDVFAPDAMPVAVRAEILLAGGPRSRVVDASGGALYLPAERGLEERLATTLRDGPMRALLGDIGVDAALPTIFPLAVVVEGARGPELRSLAVPGGSHPRAAAAASAQAAREAGASAAAVSLAEIREELAHLLVQGLGAITPRATDALSARLRDLSLEKQAALLDAVARRAAPAERLDDIVKLYQVLEIALVRLLASTSVALESLERVPTYEGVRVPRPAAWLDPLEVSRRRAAGDISRYEAAVHYARYYDALPADRLAASVFPVWADGAAGPFVARAFAARGASTAVAACRRALSMQAGRVARMTAIRVLQAAGNAEARSLLAELRSREKDVPLGILAAEALESLDRTPPAPTDREGRDLMDRLLHAGQKDDRENAARQLAERGRRDALPSLRVAYESDATQDVRDAAAIALGRLLDTESADTFVWHLAGRDEDDAAARAAAWALGHLGDVRGIDALVAAWSSGWRPAIVGDAIRAMGVVALGPLLAAVEENPALADRKASVDVLQRVPPEELTPVLEERLLLARAGTAFPDRAALLLRLAGAHEATRRAVAEKIVALVGDSPTEPERALFKAARKALEAKPKKAAKAKP
jgi:hypothetical protein